MEQTASSMTAVAAVDDGLAEPCHCVSTEGEDISGRTFHWGKCNALAYLIILPQTIPSFYICPWASLRTAFGVRLGWHQTPTWVISCVHALVARDLALYSVSALPPGIGCAGITGQAVFGLGLAATRI